MNTKLNMISLVLILILALNLSGCGAVTVPGDVLGLQSGTTGWVLATSVANTHAYVLTLQSVLNPTQIVTFAQVADGFGMASVDLSTQSEYIRGSWLAKGSDLTAILQSALSKGNWKIISREEAAKLITTAGTSGPVILEWVKNLTLPMSVVNGGIFILPGDIMNDTLRKIGFRAGEPG